MGPRNDGDDTLMVAEQSRGKLPDTAIALTGGGGYHHLFKHHGARLRSPGRGVDIKSTGGYIVVEPPTHVSGSAYAWEGMPIGIEDRVLPELVKAWMPIPEPPK